MKSTILLIVFAIFTALIIFTQRNNAVDKNIFKTSILNSASANSGKDDIFFLESQVKSDPTSIEKQKRLGFAYIHQARESGDYAKYDEQSLKVFEAILKKNENDFEALIGKSTVLLSMHRFDEAKIGGHEAISVNRYNPAGYGILTDAFVETGDYKRAVVMADSMVLIRPDLRSYSRISYLREIHGDYPGAIQAMKMAIQSGNDGSEETEWSRYHLGCLYEKTGDLNAAADEFQKSQVYRPAFSLPYIGYGRILQKQKDYPEAEQYYRNAEFINPGYLPSMQLGILYREWNKPAQSVEAFKKAVSYFEVTNTDGSKSHFTGKELAELYLESNDIENAFRSASEEYNRRPENIDVNHTLARCYYTKGNYPLALFHIMKALRTGSKNATLLMHAGIIHKKTGFEKLGELEIKKAREVNPFVSTTEL